MLALARIIRQFSSPCCQTIRRAAAGTTNIGKCFRRFYMPCRYAPSSHLPSIKRVCSYSVQVNLEGLTVDYDYVKQATGNSNTLIIDVREPHELTEFGKIPNSINIPLGDVSRVLGTMSEKDFEKAYRRPKPVENTEIIFYCMIGKRSGMAQENAINLGFKNAKNYLGSFTDWANKTTN